MRKVRKGLTSQLQQGAKTWREPWSPGSHCLALLTMPICFFESQSCQHSKQILYFQAGTSPRAMELLLALEHTQQKIECTEWIRSCLSLSLEVSGCTFGEDQSWPRGSLCPDCLHPRLDEPCSVRVWLGSTEPILKRHLTHSYSDFRNKCSAPLIRMPGVNRAGDNLRNAPDT